MNKKILILSFTFFTINTYSMLKIYPEPMRAQLKYDPCVQPENTHTYRARTTLSNFAQIYSALPSLDAEEAKKLQLRSDLLEATLINMGSLYAAKYATDEEKKYDCTSYAVAKTIGFKNNPTVEQGVYRQSSLNLFKYFKQTNSPQTNDLAICSREKEFSSPTHTSIVINNDTFECKLGLSPCIIIGSLFCVPNPYGNYVYFFTLRSRFRALPKELLINLMTHDTTISHGNANATRRNRLLKAYSFFAHLEAIEAIELLSEIELYID